ncbi:MAG: Mrp/NBP35 family ATP-binding protein [Phycisphaerales bacterium]|nr:Mrp/NBP35 family ATP-binding protein [Phycisphaerales bacterium]
MSLNKEAVIEILKGVREDDQGGDVIAVGAVSRVAACDGHVTITLAPGLEAARRARLTPLLDRAVRAAASSRGWPVAQIAFENAPATVAHDTPTPVKQAASSPTVSRGTLAGASGGAGALLPGVRHVIAVGAGKGGVGKSTVAVNLAVGLARQGHAVGLLDGDIYGPSAPTLLGLDSLDTLVLDRKIQVFAVHGIKAMTIGKLVDPEKPLIWRGPMAHGAFKQLVEQTAWGELDYLVIDLPPGTGDVPLTMSQLITLTGAVVVCTPQKVAQDDAVRAVRMFQQLNVEVLGVVENMSYFIGDDGKEYDIFGRGGAEMMAQRLGLPFLGAIPINTALRRHSDEGTPLRNFTDAGDAVRTALERLVHRAESEVAIATLKRAGGTPRLSVS